MNVCDLSFKEYIQRIAAYHYTFSFNSNGGGCQEAGREGEM